MSFANVYPIFLSASTYIFFYLDVSRIPRLFFSKVSRLSPEQCNFAYFYVIAHTFYVIFQNFLFLHTFSIEFKFSLFKAIYKLLTFFKFLDFHSF